MTLLAELAVLLLVTWCVQSALDKVPDTLEVLYSAKTVTAAKGSSVELSCIANYDAEHCGLVHVAWYQNGIELTDPAKHLTTVNETVYDGVARRRQVVTEIVGLAKEDGGPFQCKAECESGDSAMGHFIRISVKG